MVTFLKTSKSSLRWLRHQLIGDSWKEQIRPVSWWNFPAWVWETIEQDRQFYSTPSRPLSAKRLWGTFQPNLSQPIFIFGAPRSGTTFLGKCISNLPELSYHFEPVLTKAAVRYVYTQQWSYPNARRFYRSVYAWLMLTHLNGDLRFCEKTPRNCFILPFLWQTFPDAKFIHIIRDGRDASLSLSHKPWYKNDMKGSGAKDPGGYPFGPKARFWVEPDRIEEFETTSDLHRCIWLWRRYLESAREGASQLPPQQYHEIKYENLVQTPELEATKLLDFLEITTDSSRLKFVDVVTTKARPDSIGQWQQHISDVVLEKISAEAGQMLNNLGYSHSF